MSNNYNPFDILPPKDIIKNAIKQLKANAFELLEDIRQLRSNPVADWLVAEKEKNHKQLTHKIHRYEMYLRNVDISKDWEAAKEQAKQYPIKDLYNGQLHRAGGRWVGKCPFHKTGQERTPSFVIYPNNTFHCFACQANGDAIDFIQKKENLDFKSAIKFLSG